MGITIEFHKKTVGASVGMSMVEFEYIDSAKSLCI
jgi:hypothetical protein